jgi:hypothetical protein
MYMQNDIVAAASPTFHIDLPKIDPAERSAEIDRVIAIATAAIPKAQMKKLGRLSFAQARDDDDHSYFGQIRSEPLGACGLEFRFPMPARETGHQDPEQVAAKLAESAVCIARESRGLKKFAALMREVVDEAIESAKGGIAELRVIALGVTPGRSAEQLKVTIDVEMLGDDLTTGIERVTELTDGGGLDRLQERLKELCAKHVERRKALARAKVAGVSGWIDDSALRILDVSGLGRSAALAMLRLDRQVDFRFGGERGYELMGGVYWEDGVVCGYVESRERGKAFRLEAGVLTIESNQLPATIVASLVGRHLGGLIDIDFIPGNALITEVGESGEWLYLRLEIGTTPIEEAVV